MHCTLRTLCTVAGLHSRYSYALALALFLLRILRTAFLRLLVLLALPLLALAHLVLTSSCCYALHSSYSLYCCWSTLEILLCIGTCTLSTAHSTYCIPTTAGAPCAPSTCSCASRVDIIMLLCIALFVLSVLLLVYTRDTLMHWHLHSFYCAFYVLHSYDCWCSL